MQAPPTRYTYSYYDIVLALIPLPIISAWVAGWIAGVPLEVLTPAAALLSIGLMAHAMFWRGIPTTPSTPTAPEETPTHAQPGASPPDGPAV